MVVGTRQNSAVVLHRVRGSPDSESGGCTAQTPAAGRVSQSAPTAPETRQRASRSSAPVGRSVHPAWWCGDVARGAAAVAAQATNPGCESQQKQITLAALESTV